MKNGIGKRLRMARWDAGMTQKQLAETLNEKSTRRYSRYKIINIENGHREITKSESEDLAAALGVTPEYLLFGKKGGEGNGDSE